MPTPAAIHPLYLTAPDGSIIQVGSPLVAHPLGRHEDVDLVTTPPNDGQTIIWDSMSMKWIPGAGAPSEVFIDNVEPTPTVDAIWADISQSTVDMPYLVPGPAGPTGPPGVSSIMVGSFGAVATPASLPPTGLIPVDFDGAGNPAVAYQMELGQSLLFDKVGDPLDGVLFQYVSTAVTAEGWIELGSLSGPPGANGEQGATGPEGPPGDMTQAIADTRYLQLTGGTVDGNVTIQNDYLTMTGDGYGVLFAGDGRMYKRVGGGLVIRQHADLKLQVENTAGTSRWTVLDTQNIVGTTYSVSYQNGWSGTMDFRVSPAMVTCRMLAIKRNAVTNAYTESKICDYPSGVPAPYGDLWQTTTIREADYTTYPGNAIVNLRPTSGVWVRMTSDGMTANDRYIDCTISWAR